jgi:toxin FitB
MHHRSETLGEDTMMAATARVHGLTVATRNERDFAHFDVAAFNPFKQRVL